MKKFLSLLLAVMMLLSCIPAMAEEPTWKVIKTTGVVKCSNSTKVEGHIAIPAEVDGIKVMGLDYMAFMSNKKITGLTIPDSVRYIDRDALAGLTAVTSLTLPKELVVIRSGSIRDMDSLESLVIPATVQLVHGAIVRCSALKSVTFEGVCPLFPADDTYKTFHDLHPDCVIYVPDDQVDAYKAAFAGDDEVLRRIQPSGKNAVIVDWTAPESDFAFDAATGTITKYTGTSGRVDIPAAIGGVAVRAIGSRAFASNYTMYVLNIPEGVDVLEGSCFSDCDGLVYVKFPSTLKTIEDYAFNSSNALWVVDWAEGLETLGKGVFASGPKLFHAKLPTTLRVIGDKAFIGAYLKTLTFGPNVETVGEMAFANNQLTAITYTGTAMPTFGADAFKGCTKAATLTLADGCPKELYDSFVAYMADAFPSCVVNEPATMEMPFPALDEMAGMPFFGDWHAVAGKDVMGDFTNEYPVVTATLNPDGTANFILDGVEMPSAWYVDAGYAFLAPVENGKADAAQTYCYANIDENGRLVIDLGYAAAICEQDGKVYAAPARPEIPWPELNKDDAKYYIGTWQTADGSMTLTLNEDGTASSVEPGEEPYALRWYADYPSAFVGETVNTAFEINFDGNGNIELDMDGQKLILSPYVEATVIKGADELLGVWYDDIGNKLNLVNDGTMTYTYASDGWVNEYKWNVVDGTAVVTEGNWANCPITLENGILTITNGEGIFQIFSVDGDLSAYYGEDEYALPEAQPIGPEGEAYFGAWKADMYGMTVIMTLNQDGTCTMNMMGEVEPGVWAVVDGKANIMGDELYINGDGNLVYEGAGMVFTKAEGDMADSGEMSEEEQMLALLAMLAQMEGMENGGPEQTGFSYVDTSFVLTQAATVFNGQSFPVDAQAFGEYTVRFNSNGSAQLVQSGLELPSEYLTWSNNDAGEYVIDYSVNGVPVMNYVFIPADGALTFDYYGTMMTFTPAE